MSWPHAAASRFRALFTRQRLDCELEDEVGFHLEMQIHDNVRAGMSPAEARRSALRSFGGIEPVKEQYRDRRAFAPIETALRDLRYALRTLRKSPAYTVSSIAVLALAIGANTAMFSVLNAVLFRPLPYREPDRLAMLWTEIPAQNVREGRTAFWNIEQWRKQSSLFSDLAVSDPASLTMMLGGEAERVSVARVSPNLFSILGILPFQGRFFSDDDAAHRQHVAVISYRFWQTRLGGSPNALGTQIELDGFPTRIIGILPADLTISDSSIWEPHTLFTDWDSLRTARGTGSWFVFGRLAPGATFAAAQSEMNAIAQRLDAELPAGARNRGVAVVPLTQQLAGTRTRLTLWMLMGAVVCVLLIAAANVAGLGLARGASREREIAIRMALGAGRARIIAQLLAESLTLAAISGLLALAVGSACIQEILALKPADLPRLNEMSLDPRVFAVAAALCLLTGIAVGLAPAITLSRHVPSGRGIAGAIPARRLRRHLVAGEFALAIVLLAGAGLMIRSLWSIQNVDPGFRSERVLMLSLAVPPLRSVPQRVDFYTRVVEQAQSIPGVESAAVIGDLLINGAAEQFVGTEGTAQAQHQMRLRRDEVTGGLFHTIGAPLLAGRYFTAADGPDAPAVAIVNQTMARLLWPGLDPVGKRFRLAADSSTPWFTVVGIVADMHRQGLEKEPVPQMFEPLAQNPSRMANLVVKTSVRDSLQLTGALQAAVHRVDRYAPSYGVTTFDAKLDAFLAQRRFQLSLLVGFSVAALLMAAIGIYGLIQYSVASRTHEIGIRIAVGARSGEILRLIMGEGLKLTLTGLIAGLAAAVVLGGFAESLLYGVKPADPLTLAAVSLLLSVVAALACYVPARRATRIDAITALRQD